ncbi:hypothetical protein YC2023_085408 [Brassica napus]
MAGQSVLSYWLFYGAYLTILGYNETHKLIMKSLKQNRRNKKTLILKHRAKSLFLTGTRDAPRRSAL